MAELTTPAVLNLRSFFVLNRAIYTMYLCIFAIKTDEQTKTESSV